MFTHGEARALWWWTAAGLVALAAGIGWRRAATAPPVMPAPAQAALEARLDAARRVDLNTADALTLEALPGIGRARAEAIIAYRAAHGRFRDMDAVARVPGLPPEVVERMRGFVRVREGGG